MALPFCSGKEQWRIVAPYTCRLVLRQTISHILNLQLNRSTEGRNMQNVKTMLIKADRPLTRDTLNTPWLLTDNSNGLVTVICNYHWLNSASRVLISTCSAPLVQTGQRKQFSLFDLDLWPTTLTYNHRLANVKVDPHAKNQGLRSNGSNRKVPTDKQTDTHTHTHTHGRY